MSPQVVAVESVKTVETSPEVTIKIMKKMVREDCSSSIPTSTRTQLNLVADALEMNRRVNKEKKDERKERVEAGPSSSGRRVLLILDINGLLLDNSYKGDPISKRPRRRADAKSGKPHAISFLNFLIHQLSFDIAMWSSGRRYNIMGFLNTLLQGTPILTSMKFIWDQSHCTLDREKVHPTNPRRPVFFKELSKVWDEFPMYDSSNTLLIDDSEYKAQKNPPFTSIHPLTYEADMLTDNELGEGGHLYEYLKRLSSAAMSGKGVPAFLEENPYMKPNVAVLVDENEIDIDIDQDDTPDIDETTFGGQKHLASVERTSDDYQAWSDEDH